jgi:hypothetical protein
MLDEWLHESAEVYLNNILASETIHDQGEGCVQCKDTIGNLYQCRDCVHCWSYCRRCLVANHHSLPTHRFREWTGRCFRNISSDDIEYIFHLGHGGEPCDLGKNRKLHLGDTNGFHTITVRYCRHPGRGSHSKQLLQARIFPCSEQDPQSAFTFDVMRLFQLLATEAKLSTQRFYNVLVYRTNPTFPSHVPDRYREFLRTSRQWQLLQSLKRSGRTTIKDTTTGNITGAGDQAIRCPACPRVGVNFEHYDVQPGDE